MSVDEIKAIYNSLKDSGDLKLFHSQLTGEWTLDEKKFTSLYRATENLMGGLDEDDDLTTHSLFEDQF